MVVLDSTFLVALIFAILITTGYDAILHGLSHGSHNLVNIIWRGEHQQRKTSTIFISTIQWHIVADMLIGSSVAFLTYIVLQVTTDIWTAILVLFSFGILASSYYIHVYSAYQIGVRSSLGLAVLAFFQIILTSGLVFLIVLLI